MTTRFLWHEWRYVVTHCEVGAGPIDAAECMHQACGLLAQQAGHLRAEVDRFIEQIRAA